MSVNKYVTESLLSSARLRAFVPTDTQSWPDASVLSILNDELTDWLCPLILEARQGHFQVSFDQALTANVNTYAVPADALGGMVYTLLLCDSSGSPVTSPLASKPLEEVAWMWSMVGTPQQYTFQGDNILLYPTPDGAYPTLRMKYPRRPSQVVVSTECSTLNFAASVGATVLAPASVLSTFTTGVQLDLVSPTPPCDVIQTVTITSVAGGNLNITPALTSAAPVGTLVCITKTAPVLTGVPGEAYSLMAQRVAVKMVEAKGDAEALSRATAGLEQAEARFREFLGKRDQGAHKKVVASRTRFYGWPYRFLFPYK